MRNLNLDQLQALDEIVRLGSFSAAARKLNLSQPAVSLKLRELESRMGVRLVERIGRRVRATPAGEDLIAHARRLAAEAERALVAMRRHREGGLGRVRLGTSTAVCVHLLPTVLGRMRARHPDLEVSIQIGPTRRVVTRIAANELDVGIVTLPAPELPGVVVSPLRSDPMVALFPPDMAAPRKVTAAALAALPLIFDEPDSQTYRITEEWFRAQGVEPHPIMEVANTEAMKSLVAAGVGVAILPDEREDDPLLRGRAQVRPLSPALHRRLGVALRRDKPIEGGLKVFLEGIRSLAKGRA